MIDDEKVFDEEEMFDNLVFDKAPLETYNNIGKRGIRRLDGFEKATRQGHIHHRHAIARHAVRQSSSPRLTPMREIKRMDTRRAEALPGVRYVLRYDDPELPARADLGGHAPLQHAGAPEGSPLRGRRSRRFRGGGHGGYRRRGRCA